MPKKIYKAKDFEIYCLWKAIPSLWLGRGDKEMDAWGVKDEILRELASIKTQTEFAHKFGIKDVSTLTDWNRRIEKGNLQIDYIKKWGKKLTHNLIHALYRNALLEGDAARIKLWLSFIEDFKEKTETEIHSPEIKTMTNLLKKLAEKKDDDTASETDSENFIP